MLAGTYFTIIVAANETNLDFFKNMLESIDEQEYRDFELYILDENNNIDVEAIIKEFFPDMVDKVHYRKLKNTKGRAYTYNSGARFAEGKYLVFLGQHDRLSANTLLEINKFIEAKEENTDGIIYTDHDELVGLDRMQPHFKCDLNKELLYHTNYIGDFFCISKECFANLGPFNEKAVNSFAYEYYLRACSKKVKIKHLPMLLYHKRQIKAPISKEERLKLLYVQREHMAISKSYLEKNGLKVNVSACPEFNRWEIDYDNSEFRRFGGDYMYLHQDNVRLYTRKNVQYMYGFLKEPDVAVVGVRFIERGLSVDNIGYIFDENGMTYPAFHGQKIYQQSYENLAKIPRDVAMVDAGCCLIDAKVYRMLHGFDTTLSGRDAMLDFCLRARAKGYRTVVVPKVVAKYKEKKNVSNEESHTELVNKHMDIFKEGDNCYNKNLPMGYKNFLLPGVEE